MICLFVTLLDDVGSMTHSKNIKQTEEKRKIHKTVETQKHNTCYTVAYPG